MENAETGDLHRKRRSNGGHSHISSMSDDNQSTTSQVDSWHSPLRSDDPENDTSGENNCRALVLVDKYYYSPVPSPEKSSIPASSPVTGGQSQNPTASENNDVPARGAAPVVVGVNRLVREEAPVRKMEEGYGGDGDEVGGERRSRAAVSAILRGSGRGAAVRKVALGFRVFEMIACLISFSVMAADKTEGWSGDSFDRYKEYRYCLAVNVIGFAYSGFQACDLSYHLGTGKHIISHHLHYHFDFLSDQILAYILMSASSSAATRVNDWISNWGGDEFTLMASASIAMSFLAFVAFALSSLVSGYNLCNRDSS